MGSVATSWTVPRSIACDGGVALVRWRGSPKQYRDTDVRPQSLSKNGYGRRTIRALCDLGVCKYLYICMYIYTIHEGRISLT